MEFKRPIVSEALVTGVERGSPAAQAALAPGDIVTGVSVTELPDLRAIQRAITLVDPGTLLTLAVWHNGERKEVSVRGEPWPHFKKLQSEVIPSEADIKQALRYGLGLHVVAITQGDRKRFHLGDIRGVLIDRVDPDTQAEAVGFELGDVIEQIGGQPANSPEQVMADLAYGKSDSDDLTAVLVHQKTGSRWFSLWLGGANSRDFVNRDFAPGPAGAVQSTTAER